MYVVGRLPSVKRAMGFELGVAAAAVERAFQRADPAARRAMVEVGGAPPHPCTTHCTTHTPQPAHHQALTLSHPAIHISKHTPMPPP